MAINPLLPLLLAASLAGLVFHRRPLGRAWVALGLAATALLAPALALPGGIPSPAASLARQPPWQGTADPAEGNPALGDVVHQIQPWMTFLRRELRAGRLPLWNPHQYSGSPFWANGQSAPLFPLHLLFVLLPAQAGWLLLPWLRVVIGGLGTRALARQLGLGEAASLVAGLIFPLSGMLVCFLLYPMGNALALVPWVLLAVERLAAGRSGLLPLALASGLQLLAGHPETALHTALLSALYLAVRGAAPGRRWIAWGGLAGGWALGGALAAVQLLPLTAFVLDSSRWRVAAGDFAEPLGRLLAQPLRLVLPDLFGNPADGTWWGPYNYLATAVYAGAAALPLAAAGLGMVRRPDAGRRLDRRLDRRWLAVAALALFSFAAAYHLPGVRQLLAALPVVGRAAHHRLLFGVELGLALLAAAGYQRWRQGRGGRGLVAGALLVAALATVAWWRFAGEWSAHGLIPRQAAVTAAAAVFVALLALGLGTGRSPAGSRRHALLAAALPLLVAVELLAAHGRINPGLPLDRLYPETGAVRFLAGRPGRVAATGRTLQPNAAMVYGLDDIRGDDTLKLDRYVRLERRRFASGHPTYFVPIRRWDRLWLDRLGVRWVMGGPGEAPPVAGWRLAYDGDDARVWERSGALPPVRWAGGGAGRRVTVVGRRPGRWRLQWASPDPGLLVVAETYDRGWSASAGGRPLAVRPAGGVLIGLPLGPGSGELELVYRPAGLVAGAAISTAAAALLATLALYRRRRRGS